MCALGSINCGQNKEMTYRKEFFPTVLFLKSMFDKTFQEICIVLVVYIAYFSNSLYRVKN